MRWQYQVIETVIIVVIAVILLSIARRLVVGRRPSARRTARRPAMALSHTSDGDV